MKRVLLAGATGLVGQATLQRALASTAVSEVVAPTRRPLPAHPKLLNPVVDFDALPGDAAWWQADAVACALGTTIRDAGSREAFRRVDHDYCLAIARHAHAHGAQGHVVGAAQVPRDLVVGHQPCDPLWAQPVVCFSIQLNSSYITIAIAPTTSRPLKARPICIEEPAEISR